MKSKDRYRSGLALEALAFKIMRLLDMTYVATRLRANQTGGAEVDLVFESARLVFFRWQIQCKNTARVTLARISQTRLGICRMEPLSVGDGGDWVTSGRFGPELIV